MVKFLLSGFDSQQWQGHDQRWPPKPISMGQRRELAIALIYSLTCTGNLVSFSIILGWERNPM
jgi:hypothetical protein